MPTKLKAKAPEETNPGKLKAMLYGASGVGKSWLALDFPNVYYIDSERGASLKHYQEKLKAAGGSYFGVDEGSLDPDCVLEQVQALATEKHAYKTLVIDSITKIYQTAIAKEAERLGDKDVFGASKKPAVTFVRRLLGWITRLDMNVWLVAHETGEWSGSGKDRVEIGKIGDVYEKVIYELHLTLQAQKRGNSRVAVVKKSRLTGFTDGDTIPLEYAEISKRYGKDFIEAESTPIILASPEQVAEIKRLLEVVKVSEADIEKVLTKASAEKWEELNTDQAAATIAWLTKRGK